MEAVEGLGKDLTIIIITHRLSTVAGCHQSSRKGVISADLIGLAQYFLNHSPHRT